MPLFFYLPVIVGMGMINVVQEAFHVGLRAVQPDPAIPNGTSIIRFPARGPSLAKEPAPPLPLLARAPNPHRVPGGLRRSAGRDE